MKRNTGVKRVAVALAVIAVTVFPALALCEEPATPPVPVSLILDVAAEAPVDAERLRAAVALELGVPVVWQRNAAGGTLVVRQAGPRVIVSFDGPDGRHDGRGIPLAGDSAQAESDITLLAGNVARDQAAQFVPPPPPAWPALPPAPTPVAMALPPPRPSPCNAAGPRLLVGVDLAPWIGVSTADAGRSIRSFSFGALGALSGGVRGLAMSGLVDISRGPLCGLQVSGIVNIAANARGAQVSGIVNIAADARGAQVSGIVNVAQRLAGVQIAGVVNSSQGDSSGVQIGTVNVTVGRMDGVQIGVVNYAGDADFQLGLVNINASGRFLLDAWANPEMGLVLAGVKHGGARYHWIYALGVRAADAARPWAALGVGAHVTPADKLYADLDVIDELQLAFRSSSTATALYQARVVVGYRVLPQLAVFAGPTYNLLAAATTARTGAPGYATDLADTSSTTYLSWPGVTLGVEGL